jgi:arylsulfatase A-like enzyme
MVIAWPVRIKDGGGIRHQFHHFIDIVPTILDAAGIKAPLVVDGIEQNSIEGRALGVRLDRRSTGSSDQAADPGRVRRGRNASGLG